MTFAEALTACYLDTGFDPSTIAPLAVTRFKSWINRGYLQLLRDDRLSELRQVTGVTFPTIAGEPVYAMPQAFERIDRVVETSTDRRLVGRTLDWLRAADPAERMSGVPEVYIALGLIATMHYPPAAGATLYAVSSAVGDTMTVAVAGLLVNGDQFVVRTHALTGTTPVVVSPALVTRVTAFSLPIAATGDVSLYDGNPTTGARLLARIPAGLTSVQYQGVRLWRTPSAAYTIVVDGQVLPTPLIDPGDVPLFPPSFHELLVLMGKLGEYERTQDKRYGMTASQLADGRDKLLSYQQFPRGYRPVAGTYSGLGGVTWPALDGGYWPADVWPS